MADISPRHIACAGLMVAAPLVELVEQDILLPADDPESFWRGFEAILRDMAPRNAALLARREALQRDIDAWHTTNPDASADSYRSFLTKIGYLEGEPEPFSISTSAVDDEIALLAGPQLVVPVNNARFALNAANARFGSLYDALYGTDALPGDRGTTGYDEARGRAVVTWVRAHLDAVAPLAMGSWAEVTELAVESGNLVIGLGDAFTRLADPAQFAGYRDTGDIILRINGLLIEIRVDRNHSIGRSDPAGICDIVVESALTAIQDCEDSVAAVDAEDKCRVYANWLGLMKGDLAESFSKGGKAVTRRLAADVSYLAPDRTPVVHPGRALLLVRNVGHLMTTDAVRLDGRETPEGILDAVMTVAAARHDLARKAGPRNARQGSIYVVKPKMHGSDEVRFTNDLMCRVEDLLGLPRNTVKIGVMDEERRTSANLSACIAAVSERCVFINTGFLDRTGDEIHTSMQAGAMLPRTEMAGSTWLQAYERGNVARGLAAGLAGRAQIGKGMWAKPDAMADMLRVKGEQLRTGATTAWVPSPTAATLHATHYHRFDARGLQRDCLGMSVPELSALLTPPLLKGRSLPPDLVRSEIEGACQSILGYVVRWIDQGIGCSKIPDMHDIALMEDRATLRISSQLLANWLKHGVCTPAEVDDALCRMAVRVDAQNVTDASYHPMAPSCNGEAFRTARGLIFEGARQPSGYTEPLLHAARRRVKTRQSSH